jgi:hypothetical protein
VYEIWDTQTGALLADGLINLDAARTRLEELLGQIRRQVEATGDSVSGMYLEWEIRDAATGDVVGWHTGEPAEMPW